MANCIFWVGGGGGWRGIIIFHHFFLFLALSPLPSPSPLPLPLVYDADYADYPPPSFPLPSSLAILAQNVFSSSCRSLTHAGAVFVRSRQTLGPGPVPVSQSVNAALNDDQFLFAIQPASRWTVSQPNPAKTKKEKEGGKGRREGDKRVDHVKL